MKRLIYLTLLLTVLGCDGSANNSKGKINDPQIRIKETVGGGIGPVGGGRAREYEGPASHAPDWVKSKNK